MKKALLKDSIKQIRKTNKRFISILLMAFLGVGFFAGVRATSPDMKLTIDNHLDKHNVYDINLVSTLGLTEEDVQAISDLKGVKNVYGTYSKDTFISFETEEVVVKAYALENDFNKLELIDGNFPQAEDECVVEKNMINQEGINIGDYINIREEVGEDEENFFKNTKLKVVGIVDSPIYISRDRGTTTLGSGKISYYIYVSKDNIISDIFTEIDILVEGAKEELAISDEYDNLILNVEEELEKIKTERETARYNKLIEEANKKLDEARERI